MVKNVADLATVVAWAKRRGFVYPGSDIYGGLANARDYGPYGSQLRKNIMDAWWQFFVQEQPNIVGIDGAILMHPQVREASGHVNGFNDPLIDDKNTGERFRADKLIENRLEEMISQSDEANVATTIADQYGVPNLVPDSWSFAQQHAFIIGEQIPNPNNKKQTPDWTDVRAFSLMLSTQLGVIE